jgi:hypothetical protein
MEHGRRFAAHQRPPAANQVVVPRAHPHRVDRQLAAGIPFNDHHFQHVRAARSGPEMQHAPRRIVIDADLGRHSDDCSPKAVGGIVSVQSRAQLF